MFSDLVLKVLDPSWDIAPYDGKHLVNSSQHFGDFSARGIHMDIKENETQYEIVADMPGITKDQAKLDIKDHVLTIAYERNFETKSDGETYHRMERFQGTASRSIRLPRDVDEDKVEASFNNGVLQVVIQKLPKVVSKPTTIN
jgi:HSP20 family protein